MAYVPGFSDELWHDHHVGQPSPPVRPDQAQHPYAPDFQRPAVVRRDHCALPTELVATYLQHSDQVLAAMVYSGLFMLIAILFNMLWWYANSQGLLGTDVDPTATSRVSRQYIFGSFLYLIALLLALISVPLSLALNLLLAIFYALPNSILDAIFQRGNR